MQPLLQYYLISYLARITNSRNSFLDSFYPSIFSISVSITRDPVPIIMYARLCTLDTLFRMQTCTSSLVPVRINLPLTKVGFPRLKLAQLLIQRPCRPNIIHWRPNYPNPNRRVLLFPGFYGWCATILFALTNHIPRICRVYRYIRRISGPHSHYRPPHLIQKFPRCYVCYKHNPYCVIRHRRSRLQRFDGCR